MNMIRDYYKIEISKIVSKINEIEDNTVEFIR